MYCFKKFNLQTLKWDEMKCIFNRESLLIKTKAFSYQTEGFWKWYSKWIHETKTKIKVVLNIFIDIESDILQVPVLILTQSLTIYVYMYIPKDCTIYIMLYKRLVLFTIRLCLTYFKIWLTSSLSFWYVYSYGNIYMSLSWNTVLDTFKCLY